jgi:CheY-like chemotaxis protein
MALKIAILEDNLDRQAVMRACLKDRFYTFDTHFFDDSSEIIRFLEAHLSETVVIALDNDLELKSGPNGQCIDPGSGCHVAEFLASKSPVCPVIIHTTNTAAAATMQEVLRTAGWKTRRVVPYEDMKWIETEWFFAVRRALVGPIRKPVAESRS